MPVPTSHVGHIVLSSPSSLRLYTPGSQIMTCKACRLRGLGSREILAIKCPKFFIMSTADNVQGTECHLSAEPPHGSVRRSHLGVERASVSCFFLHGACLFIDSPCRSQGAARKLQGETLMALGLMVQAGSYVTLERFTRLLVECVYMQVWSLACCHLLRTVFQTK